MMKIFWKQYNTTPLSQKLTESLVQAKNEAKSAEVFDSVYMAEVQRLQDSIKTVTSESRTGDISISEDFDFDISNYTQAIRRQRKFR
ncbi:MAG: hypothetical protein IPJ74_26725 [Saprospiraceae bacterium]|nr:hypothetical protein [Saprospiraceae bacterium]